MYRINLYNNILISMFLFSMLLNDRIIIKILTVTPSVVQDKDLYF